MDKNLNPIKEAEEILKRPYARVQSIANAWEFLLNREQEHSEPRRLRIEGKKNFIDALNLPIHYVDGSPASKANGTSVEEVLNKHSICVSVQSVYEAAIKADLPWPLPTITMDKTSKVGIKDDIDKPWLAHNPLDPLPVQSWYTPARFFAREIIKERPALINNKKKLAAEVSTYLFNIKDFPRGKERKRDYSTILKAFTNVILT